MKYDIYVAPLSSDSDVAEYGVEIQPPLSSLALNGLIHRLTNTGERENNRIPVAEYVSVTREDEQGTALIVTSGEGIFGDSQFLGTEIEVALNPCDLDMHQINVHVEQGHYS